VFYFFSKVDKFFNLFLYLFLKYSKAKMRPTFSGPSSSTGNYKSTTDPGKSLPSGQNTGGYRRTGNVSGPDSSHSTYSPTLDPGKSAPISGTGPKFCQHCGTQHSGGLYCSNCGKAV